MNNMTISNEIKTDVSDLTENQVGILQKSINSDLKMAEFKARHFVGNAQITPYAKLKQYMLEANSRESAVVQLEYQFKLIEVRIARQKHLVEKLTDQFDKVEQQVELDYMLMKREEYVRNIKATVAERKMYLQLVEEILSGPYGTLDDGTSLIDALSDPILVERFEREYWTLRMSKQAAMDMVAYGRIGVGNMDSIAMLGAAQQNEVLALASDYLVKNEMRMGSLMSAANINNQERLLETKLSDTLFLTRDE